MDTHEFDERFDGGEEVTAELDLTRARRRGSEFRRVSLDCPAWMVDALDREARRIGVTREALIKVWIGGMLKGRGTIVS